MSDRRNMSHATLTSNGLPLPRTPAYTGMLVSTPLSALEDGSARARLREDGYVLLRGLLPRELVLDLRERYFARFPHEFVADGDCRRGAFGSTPEGLPPHGTAGHPAYEFVRSDEFLAFAEHPRIKHAVERIFGAPAERLRRTPLRHFVPGRPASSRAHIDGTYVTSSAPEDLLTCWVPLGDVPLEVGGLVYLEGSHLDPAIERNARTQAPTDRPQDQRPLTHDLKWMAEYSGRRWLLADFEAGDVVVHSPLIVHASLDDVAPEMRLSTDIRFLRAGTHYDPRWRGDWAADDTF